MPLKDARVAKDECNHLRSACQQRASSSLIKYSVDCPKQ